MKNLWTTGCATVVLLFSGIAAAGSESGLYLGGSLGWTNLDFSFNSDGANVDFDDDDTGFKIFAGYNLGLVPFVDLAIEGSYVDFGEASHAVIGNADVGVTGWDAFGLAGFKLGPIGLFGKVGMITWDSSSNASQEALDDSGTDPAYGIGARFQIGSIAVRAEYELFDIDTVDISYFSVGGSWTF